MKIDSLTNLLRAIKTIIIEQNKGEKKPKTDKTRVSQFIKIN